MIDRIILFPYSITLALRDLFYRKGWKKSYRAPVPTVCVGNVTVGGTGKTPHTEMILRLLTQSDDWAYKNVAVLSRGYKRKTRGFQKVDRFGSAGAFGDEPLQIAVKFPQVNVAVDKDRVEGCQFLADPALLQSAKSARKCMDKNIPAADIIVLDDAFQYRRLRADFSVVLVDYNRPVHKDMLLPLGGLRDLPRRLSDADAVIVTKCPQQLDVWERQTWAKNLGVSREKLYFTRINYLPMKPVFDDGDNRFVYSPRLILVTGIAKAGPLKRYLSGSYEVVKHLSFPDHHRFGKSDLAKLMAAVKANPTALVATTEKDSRRFLDLKNIPDEIRQRMFEIPIEVGFLTPEEEEQFRSLILSSLR